MNKSLLTVTALLALSGIHAHAGNPRLDSVLPEIQISGGKSQIKLTPDSSSTNMNVVTPMNKSEAERPFLIRAFGKESAGTMWKEYTLTFTPQGTGDLWFSLSAPNAPKDDETLVFKVDYDKISATGATVLNGDFEEISEDERAKFWHFASDWKALHAGGGAALSGTNYVTATMKSNVGAGLQVTQGQPVTITFSARAHAQ